MSQDVHLGPLQDPRLEEIALDIFSYRFPQAEYASNLRQGERSECRRIALKLATRLRFSSEPSWSIPSGQGIDERWRKAFVATNIAKVLAELDAGVPFTSLDVSDRTWLREQAEQLVEDSGTRFRGPVDTGEKYQPENEPERDLDGRTETEVER